MHRWTDIGFAGSLALLALFASIASVKADTYSAAYCTTENTASGSGNEWDYQSNGWCTDKCEGSAFAILLGKDCWCSNYAPADDLVGTGNCSDSCAGYPSDKCGNEDKGLYLYLKMSDTAPSGTQGGTTSTPAATSKEVSSTSRTTSSSPSKTTGTSTTPAQAPPSSTSTPTSTLSSEAPVTVSRTASSASATVTPTPTTSADSLSTTPIPQTTASPQTSTRVITQSGQIVTETVVTTPTSSSSGNPTQKSSSNNTGAIVGGVVGGVVGLAAIAGLIVFLLFRRRRQQQVDQEDGADGVHRNVSTMSRSGLLRTGNSPMASYPTPINTSFNGNSNNRRQSSYMDQDSISPGSDRRNSRHLVDQRLNPSAIMYFDNSSRGSVASMDDSRDYHRPLNVRNPDPS